MPDQALPATAAEQPTTAEPTPLSRAHRARLMQIWRSAGWPCKDGLEIDLLAAGQIILQTSPEGHETLRLTDAGLQSLAFARQRGARALTAHDRLARRFGEHLLATGRIVWRELALRAALEAPAAPGPAPAQEQAGLPWSEAATSVVPAAPPAPPAWRLARPDLFSVRHTSVAAYLQPLVHEIKFSRADLLSDLRQRTKRQAYEWLCEGCYYVFPAGVAKPNEIPEHLGIWVLHGGLEEGEFELLRAARHTRCELPFAVWMALAKATPMRSEIELAQTGLGDGSPEAEPTEAPWRRSASAQAA